MSPRRTPGSHSEPEDDDVASITPAAQDFIKMVWSATEWGDPPITTTSLARRLGVTPASVSETARRLASQELITYEPYRPVHLTPRGERLAIEMVRRHRILETFLVERLGYGWDEVHDEAERLEHAASPLLISRMDDVLGHPDADPHGDPIPDASGEARTPDLARLADVSAGPHRIARVSDDDPELLSALERIGITPGVVVEVADGERVGVEGGSPVRLPEGASSAIRVRPVR